MTQRRGVSLVEVLLASAVLVILLVPLIGLMTSTKTDEQSEDGMSEAVTLSENLMEKLLSPSVPFDAIDPGGGGGNLVKGGPGGTFLQAGFRADDKSGFDADRKKDLENLFWDGDEPIPGEVRGNYRVKTVGEKTFYISFFAGKYAARAPTDNPDEPGNPRADVDNELTLAFLENPAGLGEPFNFQPADRTELDHQIVLRRGKVTLGGTDLATVPYLMGSYAVTRGAMPTARELKPEDRYFYKDKAKVLPPDLQTATLIPGWQDIRRANASVGPDLETMVSRRAWAETVSNVARGVVKPTLGYHPRVLGQRSFGLKNGGLMKLVLGIRFAPYQYSRLRSGDVTREFWLVSFKADLER